MQAIQYGPTQPGEVYLLKVETQADFSTKGPVVGELELVNLGNEQPSPQGHGLVLRLYGEGSEDTRKFSLSGHGPVALNETIPDEEWQIGAGFSQARFQYERLSFERGYKAGIEVGETPDSDVLVSEHETFSGQLTGTLTRDPESSQERPRFTLNASLALKYQEGGLGIVPEISFQVEGTFVMIYRPDTAAAAPLSNPGFLLAGPAPCPSGIVRKPREIRVEIIRFTDGTITTGVHAQTQLDAALAVWRKACINVVMNGASFPPPLPRPDLVNSDHVDDILQSYSSPAGVIEVFFVNNALAVHGGGFVPADETVQDGGFVVDPFSGIAKVIISDKTEDTIGATVFKNPNLLAHEMGHILGGSHPRPGQAPLRLWIGDTGTVLAGTGKACFVNPEWNSNHNCQRAYNVVLNTLINDPDCCQKHDENFPGAPA